MTSSDTRLKRDSVFLMAQLVGAAGAEPIRHVVRNLSADGACIEATHEIEQGQRLMLAVGQLEQVEADVAWCRGGLAGLRFKQPIDVALARKRRIEGMAIGWGGEPDPKRRRA